MLIYLQCSPLTPTQSLIVRGEPSSNHSKADPMFQLSKDPSFHYEILRDIAIAPYEGADVGEVLVAANSIVPGDFESFSAAFYELAARVHNDARAIDSTKHPVSARRAFSLRPHTIHLQISFSMAIGAILESTLSEKNT